MRSSPHTPAPRHESSAHSFWQSARWQARTNLAGAPVARVRTIYRLADVCYVEGAVVDRLFNPPANAGLPMQRVLEPEVMDTAVEAADYDAMDHREVNRRFVDDLLACRSESEASPPQAVRVVDIGTGTAQIPIELCRTTDVVHVTGVDLAAHMLQLGQRNIVAASLEARIRLEHVDAKGLPFRDGEFDWVISNSIVHHIPDPRDAFVEMVRITRPGGLLFVRDLLRPHDAAEVERLVQTYAGDANPHQQQLFRQSLHAALSLNELRDLLGGLNLPREWGRQTSDRHWTIAGRMSADL
jgi:ubiquinone/menaquinone biosynthesis C-methylase UbiE